MLSRFSFSASLVSLLCGVVVFFLFRFSGVPDFLTDEPGTWISNFRDSNTGQGCAVLVLDEFQDDRRIAGILARGGIDGFISESSQLVPVDNFGELKMVPLYSFGNEFEVFDPRDDGYASKLRAFFVQDGKRYFFLPLEDSPGNTWLVLKKRIVSLLGETPFTLVVLGRSSPVFWYFALLAFACASALYFSRSKRLLVYGLPVLLASGWGGVPAFLLSAILLGVWELLREPLRELSAARYIKKITSGPALNFYARMKPFALNIFLVFLFLAFLAVYSIAGNLAFVPLAACCACFFFLYFLSFKAEAGKVRKTHHIPFVPAPMFPFKKRTFLLSPLLFSFGIGAALAIVLPMVFPFGGNGRLPDLINDNLVSSEDYYRHIHYETSFSYRSLNRDLDQDMFREPAPETFQEDGYLRYYLGEDGLIAGGIPYTAGDNNAVPPFPLEKLMNFLVNYNESGSRSALWDKKTDFKGDWILAAIIFAACILDLIRPGKKGRKMKKVPVIKDKRIAA